MIRNDRPQNIIILATIIIAFISGTTLASSTSYYSGSYVIISYLDVELVDVRVTNLDPSNETINPHVAMDFQFTAPPASDGKASITYLRAQVYLNNESFQYTEFRRGITYQDQNVGPGYNKTFTVGSTISEPLDKQLLYFAEGNNTWTWGIILTIFYHLFESPAESVRIVAFAWPIEE